MNTNGTGCYPSNWKQPRPDNRRNTKMAETKILWTEETWNPVTGGSKLSAGCANCYADELTED